MFRWVTPNQLTLGRIVAIPVVLVLLYLDQHITNLVAMVVFFFACVTDYWDGMLARQRGEVTHLGRLLDPIADKMLIVAVLIMLVWMGVADVVPVILITVREFAVGGLRSVAATEGIDIAATRGAKWKTTMQMIAIGPLTIHHNPYYIPALEMGRVLLWAAAFWTVWTGAAYFIAYLRVDRD